MQSIFMYLPLLQVSSEVQATGAFYATIGTAMLAFLIVSIVAILLSLRSIWDKDVPQLWKLKWSAIVIIFNLVGCLAYFFIGRKEAKKVQGGEGEDGGEESKEKKEEKELTSEPQKEQKSLLYPV